jgi:hypothetical protein
LCVVVVFSDDSSGLCGGATTVHGLGNFFGGGPTPDGATGFHGFASMYVRRASVRYWSYGKLRWQRIVLTRVTDNGVLRTFGLTKPFTYYSVAVPRNARYLAFTARNKAGKIVFRRYLDCVLGGPGCQPDEILGTIPLPT